MMLALHRIACMSPSSFPGPFPYGVGKRPWERGWRSSSVWPPYWILAEETPQPSPSSPLYKDRQLRRLFTEQTETQKWRCFPQVQTHWWRSSHQKSRCLILEIMWYWTVVWSREVPRTAFPGLKGIRHLSAKEFMWWANRRICLVSCSLMYHSLIVVCMDA